MNDEKIEFYVPEEAESERVDRFLSSASELGFSRSYIQKLVERSLVEVNGVAVKSNCRLKPGDLISLTLPPVEKSELAPEDIALDIIYEDSSIAVINKSPGLVVHPGPGNYSGTLVNAIMFHIKDLSSIGGVERPGIVHRLDRDTAGLMVIAKNDSAHRALSEDFSERRIHKKYAALVIGQMKSVSGTIDMPVGRHPVYGSKMAVTASGRPAVTDYKVKRYWNIGGELFSLLDVKIHTGRTHQIRVHLSSQGNPVVGDPIYSRKWRRYDTGYLMLASVELGFKHPDTGEYISFSAELPAHFSEFIKKLDLRAGQQS